MNVRSCVVSFLKHLLCLLCGWVSRQWRNSKSHCCWVRWQSPCAVKSQSVVEHVLLETCNFNGMFWVLLRCSAKLFLLSFVGSAITGPVTKECADLWPRIASNAGSIAWVQMWLASFNKILKVHMSMMRQPTEMRCMLWQAGARKTTSHSTSAKLRSLRWISGDRRENTPSSLTGPLWNVSAALSF